MEFITKIYTATLKTFKYYIRIRHSDLSLTVRSAPHDINCINLTMIYATATLTHAEGFVPQATAGPMYAVCRSRSHGREFPFKKNGTRACSCSRYKKTQIYMELYMRLGAMRENIFRPTRKLQRTRCVKQSRTHHTGTARTSAHTQTIKNDDWAPLYLSFSLPHALIRMR